MKVQNDVKTMSFAVAQHFIETGKTRLYVFERSGIVLEVSIIKRYPDDAGAGLPEKDHIVFIEEVVQHALEEELCSGRTKHLRHLRSESMLRAWVPIDEILHVHPAARTGSPQADLFPFRIDYVTAADTKELHLVIPLMTVRCWWTSILFPCGRHSVSRERCRTGKRGQPEKFTPWLQIDFFPCHKTSAKNLILRLTIAVGWPYFNSHSKLHLRSEQKTPPKNTPKSGTYKGAFACAVE